MDLQLRETDSEAYQKLSHNTELWWVRNRDVWIRDGGDDARSAPGTAAAWATKWSRLLRLRRASSHPEGFDLAPGSPLTPGWPRVDAADRQTGG